MTTHAFDVEKRERERGGERERGEEEEARGIEKNDDNKQRQEERR